MKLSLFSKKNKKVEEETEKEAKDVEKEVIDQWKNSKSKGDRINVRAFNIPRELIKVVYWTDEYHGLILHGEGGLGKTMLTLKEIKDLVKSSDEWEYSNGYITPLALYKTLYNNRDKKVIILDDMEGIFSNNNCWGLMKGALWESDGQRIVQYSSTSHQIGDIPQQFVLKAKIIMLCNELPKKDDKSVQAILSRTINYEVKFTYKEKIELCKKFLENDEGLNPPQRTKVMSLLKGNTNEATLDFNFRTLRKAVAFIKGCGTIKSAHDLFKATTNQDETLEAYLAARKKCPNSVQDQIVHFTELTNKKRRTFYYTKEKVEK